MTGAELIAAERRRQIDAEGWSTEHDAEHADGALVAAAACYLMPPNFRNPTDRSNSRSMPLGHAWPRWPWGRQWWKPKPDDRVRELVKAGALIAAEIDRLTASSSVGAREGAQR